MGVGVSGARVSQELKAPDASVLDRRTTLSHALLDRLLSSPGDMTREWSLMAKSCAWLLSENRDSEVTARLAKDGLTHIHPEVRAAAALALRLSNTPDARSALCGALSSPAMELRIRCANLLYESGSPAEITSVHTSIAELVAWAKELIDGSAFRATSVPRRLTAGAEGSHQLSSAADEALLRSLVQSLARIKPDGADELLLELVLSDYQKLGDVAAAALVGTTNLDVISGLISGMTSSESQLVSRCICALGNTGHEGAARALVEEMNKPESEHVRACCEALWGTANPAGLVGLVNGLQGTNETISWECARALCGVTWGPAVFALMSKARGAKDIVAEQCLESLKACDLPCVKDALFEIAGGKYSFYRRVTAVGALATLTLSSQDVQRALALDIMSEQLMDIKGGTAGSVRNWFLLEMRETADLEAWARAYQIKWPSSPERYPGAHHEWVSRRLSERCLSVLEHSSADYDLDAARTVLAKYRDSDTLERLKHRLRMARSPNMEYEKAALYCDSLAGTSDPEAISLMLKFVHPNHDPYISSAAITALRTSPSEEPWCHLATNLLATGDENLFFWCTRVIAFFTDSKR